MTEDSIESVLAQQRLGRLGVEVKLDKGFAEGSYCVYVEFDELAARLGFGPARRIASAYCALLKGQLGCVHGYSLGAMEDGSRSGDARRKRDLESTYLWFEMETGDGRFHDDDVGEHFRVCSLRAGQAWDQSQAKVEAERRGSRQEKFRQRLARLLAGAAYAQLDDATKARLMEEVPALAFPARGIGQ